ncbi:hypothetical protein HELRODRAFT_171705 [Helobdella robusta]|uniref:G-protein coupled receptors family 1 profile domain-containing protein n=1 Tax=Helobdella robusta TaxID=6412 RepID=T1F4K6_HELRO|nr:hypothetical protein HELRODRAFT_171705 [Helobdella robusta]ESO05331.1 hypothetical protein HELRODRAFT_171705 [Helobdella robusta]
MLHLMNRDNSKMTFLYAFFITACNKHAENKINSVCTRSRMRKMIISLLLSCIVFNVPRFLEYTEKMEKSEVGENYYYRILYSGLLYACLLFLAPLSLLFYLNVNLVLVLRANRRNWEEFKKTQQRREQFLTKVPLTIVFIFFFCGTPSVLINITDSVDPEIYSVACLVLANSLLLINSASNFIIYCMLGKKFRGEFLKLLYCRCLTTKSPAIYRFASEYKTDLK